MNSATGKTCDVGEKCPGDTLTVPENETRLVLLSMLIEKKLTLGGGRIPCERSGLVLFLGFPLVRNKSSPQTSSSQCWMNMSTCLVWSVMKLTY